LISPAESGALKVCRENRARILSRASATDRPPLAVADSVARTTSFHHEPRESASVTHLMHIEAGAAQQALSHRTQHLAHRGAADPDGPTSQRDRRAGDAIGTGTPGDADVPHGPRRFCGRSRCSRGKRHAHYRAQLFAGPLLAPAEAGRVAAPG